MGKNNGLESWWWSVEGEKTVKEKKDLSRFYENFDTKEGQKDTHYSIAAARDRQAKDLGQMSTIKNMVKLGNDGDKGLDFKWLMNDEDTDIEQKERGKSRNGEYDL